MHFLHSSLRKLSELFLGVIFLLLFKIGQRLLGCGGRLERDDTCQRFIDLFKILMISYRRFLPIRSQSLLFLNLVSIYSYPIYLLIAQVNK